MTAHNRKISVHIVATDKPLETKSIARVIAQHYRKGIAENGNSNDRRTKIQRSA